MKRKLILSGALVLLLAIVVFMGWDLFFSKPDNLKNPYDYDLGRFKADDSLQVWYLEIQQIKPEVPVIHGIATDINDLIYVSGENSVEIFDQSGIQVNRFAINGVARCIHVDSAGLIYLGMQDHVEIYSKSGKLLNKWKSQGDQSIVTSLAVSGKNVFVADAGNKAVYQYNTDGKLLKEIGQKDPERGIPGFVIPSPYFDLGIGRYRKLWVVNPGRHSFEEYDIDGDLTRSWGKATMAMDGFCGCCNPSNFAICSDGSFVTSEKGIERIKVYDINGNFKYLVAGSDSFIEGTTGLDLAVDSKDRILVLDPGKKQIRIFEMKKP
jgi:hypothetical protein